MVGKFVKKPPCFRVLVSVILPKSSTGLTIKGAEISFRFLLERPPRLVNSRDNVILVQLKPMEILGKTRVLNLEWI